MHDKYPRFGVLLVDDELAWLNALSLTLRSQAGISHLHTCQNSSEAMDIIAKQQIGVVLLDLNMPNLSGQMLLEQILEKYPNIAVIIISGLNQVDMVVHCMKLGAFDYYVKTDEEDRIINGVLRAIRMIEMQRDYHAMSEHLVNTQLQNPDVFSGILTRDKKMLALFSYLEAVAHSPQPLLITGESGVGKELFAQAAHQLSEHKGKIIAVNVAGLDDAVFSDTLFGHVKGSFTGADQPRQGIIEQASGGTLFLDEIGDLSIASQVKLLRLLQEGEYYPLGSDTPKRLNARVIVATHQDLASKEAQGTFRKDLYYRLRTHHIEIPPLRNRLTDIPLLLDAFLDEACTVLNKSKPSYNTQLIQTLMGYTFPGNVRELRAMIFDAVSACWGDTLTQETFIHTMSETPKLVSEIQTQNPFTNFTTLPSFTETAAMLVEEAMSRSHNNQTIASRLLGISQPALNKRLKKIKAGIVNDDELI